jgi:hypothetical protein
MKDLQHLDFDDDTAERLLALADATPPGRALEVLSADPNARRGIVCWLWPTVLEHGAAGIQEILGPGSWLINTRGIDGRAAGKVALHFAGRPRPFDFASPHYARPQPADLAGTPWGPLDTPPAARPLAPADTAAAVPLAGGLDQLAQLAAIMRQFAPPPPPPPPPPPDLTPILAALVSAQRGPDLAGLAAVMQQLRPESQPSPILGIVEALAPVAGPAIAAWAEAKAAVGGPTSLFAALSPVLGHVFGTDDDDDDDTPEPAPAPAPEPARRARRMTIAPPPDDTPAG